MRFPALLTVDTFEKYYSGLKRNAPGGAIDAYGAPTGDRTGFNTPMKAVQNLGAVVYTVLFHCGIWVGMIMLIVALVVWLQSKHDTEMRDSKRRVISTLLCIAALSCVTGIIGYIQSGFGFYTVK